jgi:hypothetical protein
MQEEYKYGQILQMHQPLDHNQHKQSINSIKFVIYTDAHQACWL